MMSDRLFIVDAEKAARLQAKSNKSPVYFYQFSYPREELPSLALLWTLSEEKLGISHGDDIWFVLSNPFNPDQKLSNQDEKMKDIMLKIWTTIAKTGYSVKYKYR